MLNYQEKVNHIQDSLFKGSFKKLRLLFKTHKTLELKGFTLVIWKTNLWGITSIILEIFFQKAYCIDNPAITYYLLTNGQDG